MHGEDQHLGLRLEGPDLARRVDPVHRRQLVVEDRHIRLGLGRQLHRLTAVLGLGHHLPARLAAQDRAQPRAHNVMVVGNQDTRHGPACLRELSLYRESSTAALGENPEMSSGKSAPGSLRRWMATSRSSPDIRPSSSFRRAKSFTKPARRSDILIFLTTVVSDGRSAEMVAFGCDTLSASSALSCPPNPSDAISCRFRAMHPGSNPTGCTKPATACECYEIIRRKFD